MLLCEKQTVIKDLEGSGRSLISGNILSLAGANHKNSIKTAAVLTEHGTFRLRKKSATRLRGAPA